MDGLKLYSWSGRRVHIWLKKNRVVWATRQREMGLGTVVPSQSSIISDAGCPTLPAFVAGGWVQARVRCTTAPSH